MDAIQFFFGKGPTAFISTEKLAACRATAAYAIRSLSMDRVRLIERLHLAWCTHALDLGEKDTFKLFPELLHDSSVRPQLGWISVPALLAFLEGKHLLSRE